MKLKTALASLVALALLFVCIPLMASDAKAPETQTLTGEFVWERSDESVTGDLEAVFEPTGEATWNVSFSFVFDEKEHVYAGTAKGSLTEGPLQGRVMTDGENPSPFEFEGAFTEGNFQGKHASLRQGEAESTGTMTLSH